MADPVGVTSLVYEVSKDLYTYYRALKHCDADIKELRAQLLWLQQASDAIATTLARDGVKSEDVSQVNEATSRCTEAAEELREVLDKIRVDGPQSLYKLADIVVSRFPKRLYAGEGLAFALDVELNETVYSFKY